MDKDAIKKASKVNEMGDFKSFNFIKISALQQGKVKSYEVGYNMKMKYMHFETFLNRPAEKN